VSFAAISLCIASQRVFIVVVVVVVVVVVYFAIYSVLKLLVTPSYKIRGASFCSFMVSLSDLEYKMYAWGGGADRRVCVILCTSRCKVLWIQVATNISYETELHAFFTSALGAVSGHLHAPVALFSGKEPLVPIG
jgi:hypothetical protein